MTGLKTTCPKRPVPVRPKLLDELAELTRERFPEGLVRRLEHRFRDSGLDADAAVGDAIEIMVKKANTLQVANPRAYLAAVATNLLRRAAAKQAVLSFDDERDNVSAETAAEDEALRTEIFKYVKSLVGLWENARLRATTLLELDATFLGEPLSNEELAAQLEDILGEEVSRPTVRKWKQRGLERVADELREQGFLD
jgi:DNA-directed RNA polymerase specialized sigma24 family protein